MNGDTVAIGQKLKLVEVGIILREVKILTSLSEPLHLPLCNNTARSYEGECRKVWEGATAMPYLLGASEPPRANGDLPVRLAENMSSTSGP